MIIRLTLLELLHFFRDKLNLSLTIARFMYDKTSCPISTRECYRHSLVRPDPTIYGIHCGLLKNTMNMTLMFTWKSIVVTANGRLTSCKVADMFWFIVIVLRRNNWLQKCKENFIEYLHLYEAARCTYCVQPIRRMTQFTDKLKYQFIDWAEIRQTHKTLLRKAISIALITVLIQLEISTMVPL